MRKMTIADQRAVNGGRWRCEFCGKKTILLQTMCWHIMGEHWAKGQSGKSYKWCW